MSVDDCVKAYAELSNSIFRRHLYSHVFGSFVTKAMGAEEYRSEDLECQIKALLNKRLPQDQKDLLSDKKDISIAKLCLPRDLEHNYCKV